MKVLVTQSHQFLATPWTVALPALLSMEFSRQECWNEYSLSRGFSQLRDQTWVSCITGGFFTISATREAPKFHFLSIVDFSAILFFFFFYFLKKLVIAVGFINMSSTYHSLYCYFTFCLRTSISCSFVLSKMCHSFYFNMYYKSHSKNLAVFGFK